MSGLLLRTDWSCPWCPEVLELTLEVVEQHVDGDQIAVTTQTVPESTERVYAHAELHGIST